MSNNMKPKKYTKLWIWQQKCKDTTLKCKCGENRDLTVDHIVPVSLLEQFCLDRIETLYEMEENFEILCRYCNKTKAGRLDIRNPKTYEILDKVLKDAKEYFLKDNKPYENLEE